MTPLLSRVLIAAATAVTGLGVAPAVAQASAPGTRLLSRRDRTHRVLRLDGV